MTLTLIFNWMGKWGGRILVGGLPGMA